MARFRQSLMRNRCFPDLTNRLFSCRFAFLRILNDPDLEI